MKKKWLLLTIGLVLILSVIFIACAKPAPPPAPKPVPPPAPAPAPPPAPKPAPPPAVVPAPPPAPLPVPAAPPKVYKLKISTHVPSAIAYHKHWEGLVKDLMAASMGALDITLFPQGAVAPAAKEFDGVDTGLLDIATTCSMYWLDRWPASGLFTYTIGGLSPTESMLWHMREGVALENEMMKATNVVTIGGVITVPEAFMLSKPPMRSLADIKGLKMRAAGDGGIIFSRMGASVIFLPAVEFYPALQRGVIDAIEISSPYLNWTFAVHEIIKYQYLSPVRQPHEWMVVLANKKFWAELPDGLKVLITEMLKASTWNYYNWMSVQDLKALEDFKKAGVSNEPIPKDIEAEMARLAGLFYAEKSAVDPFFKKVYDSIESFKASFRAAWPRP